MSSETITKNDLIAILQELGHPFTPLDYYPIGSKYETANSNFDPNTAWGGTWSKTTQEIITDVIQQQVSGTIGRARGSRATLIAPTVDGYTFWHWGVVATDGWISAVYPESAGSATSNFWNTITDGSGNGNFHTHAYYYKKETRIIWHRTA